MLRENTSIAFVVDRRLRVLLWSNGLVEATNLSQDTVEGRDISSLPFLSEDNRDTTIAAIRQSFLNASTGDEEEGGSKRRMMVALVPGARTAAGPTRQILLYFTATFFEDHQHVVCIGRELEGALSSLLQGGNQALSEVSSLTSEASSGVHTEMRMVEIDSSFVQPGANPEASSHEFGWVI